jgi:hypothetical protein
MSSNPAVNRGTLQQVLASAYAVQESQMDGQFLSGIMEVQSLLAKGDLGLDGAMVLIVEAVREVAKASGAAIGVLEGDQLTYLAGSGCSAGHTGNRVTASLTVSSNDKNDYEILRVENAETDNRIEGTICRQFGVQSILILPVYRHKALGGVLEILFREAHVFEDREVRAYRLLTSLIGSAILRASSQVRNSVVMMPAIARASEPVASRRERLLAGYASVLKEQKQVISEGCTTAFAAVRKSTAEHCGTAFAAVKKSSAERCRTALAAVKKTSSERRKAALAAAKLVSALRKSVSRASASLMQRAKAVEWTKPSLNMGLATGVVVFGLIFWFAYGRGPASSSSSSITPKAAASESLIRDEPSPTDATPRAHKDKPAPAVLKPARLSRPRTASGNRSDVEHFGSDVTVRHFNNKPVAPQKKPKGNRVAYIGEDVTVRYFNAEPRARSATR